MVPKKDLNEGLVSLIENGGIAFLPGISIDCVIFGFHSNQLKVLLLKFPITDQWGLPGGFIYKKEKIEDAANRILKERTGLDHIFLRQFKVFGDPTRSDNSLFLKVMERENIRIRTDNWLLQRFLTIGYYALVEFSHVNPSPDSISIACEWCDLHQIPSLVLDHAAILETALDTLRLQLNHQPIGYNLLPQKFTMPELQKLYETILDKELDRRNFQRRMLGYGIIRRLPERREGGAHKAPYLYSFDLRKYHKALEEGLQGGW
jgi:8-oxo-dGTP diphosphatase